MRSRWRQRWYRVVIPFGVLAALVGVTLVARHAEEPNLGNAETLMPDGDGRDGGSRLAALLAERGVRVDPVTEVQQAVDALDLADASGEDVVVFVPKATATAAAFAGYAARATGAHRVVLVAPGRLELPWAGLPVTTTFNRWASQATEPACDLPEAVAAGRASALKNRYAAEGPHDRCYRGGLIRLRAGPGFGPEVFVVGSTDPFRNRRIDEHGNAELAVQLLAAHDRVIWAGALPFDVDFRPPSLGAPERPEPDRSPVDNSFGLGLLPLPVRAGLALVALAMVLVALARARRLGPLVREPLPVLVPAAEAVAGRGRLYRRSRGRGAALAALRASALPKIIRLVDLPAAPPPHPETVVAAVAGRTGIPADHVRRTLYGPVPGTDDELRTAVAWLDALVDAVRNPRQRGGSP